MPLSEIVSLKRLREESYVGVLCYPRYEKKEAMRRIQELKRLDVKALEFIGEKTAFNMPILGKGCVGIVVAARIDGRRVALKIRRVDAGRKGMEHEAEMLRRTNNINVGPQVIEISDNFLVMEFFEGMLLPKWLETLKGRGTKNRIRQVLRDILEQCWKLDEIGLDHGELSRAPKHIIIGSDDKARIVDFETASVQRRVSNLTSICQYLFIGSQTAKTIRWKLGKVNEKALTTTLRNYKRNRTRENFDKVLSVCGLSNVKG